MRRVEENSPQLACGLGSPVTQTQRWVVDSPLASPLQGAAGNRHHFGVSASKIERLSESQGFLALS